MYQSHPVCNLCGGKGCEKCHSGWECVGKTCNKCAMGWELGKKQKNIEQESSDNILVRTANNLEKSIRELNYDK